MARVIAVCNNVPDTIHTMLTDLGYNNTQFLDAYSIVPKKLKKDILFILSYHDFKVNLKVINSEEYINKTIILFCPVVAIKTLSPVLFLDVAKNRLNLNTIKSTYKNLSLDVLKAYMDKPFKKKKVVEIGKEFKYLLIEKISSGSLLNPLMSLLYTVKAENAIKVKAFVLEWLVSKDKISVLEAKLKDSYEWGTVSKKFCDKLIELFSSDLGKNYKKALHAVIELKKQPKKLHPVTGVEVPHGGNSVAKDFGVDDYELRYILNTLLKVKKHDLNGKSLVSLQNKNHRVLKL